MHVEDSSITVTYSDVQGGWRGEGNIDADPLFVDPENGNYYLQAGSPCLSNANCDGAPATDKDGRSRPLGSGCDMGCYEQFDDGSIPASIELVDKKTIIWGALKCELLQNYPNPFNPETWIPFQLAQPANVVISIYDVSGQLVRKIGLGDMPAGVYVSKDRAVYWNGCNDTGEKMSSGIYFYNIQAGNYSATKRMLILK